jgi:ABC-2 type transport system ATP-binding protein
MADDIAIRVENVFKDFVLPHEKAGSVKNLFTGIARSFSHTSEVQHALKDISFEIKKGEFFGIVGRNGSGKSTLLKILAGIYQPTSGKTYTSGKLVPFIELGVGFNPELTGRENVYLNGAMLGFSPKEVEAMYDSIVEFAELEHFMDQKLKNYSSGMQVRLAFSMATKAEADILLVDEILAVGDADFQRKCFRYFKQLKREKKTVIFVTHDMDAVREYCDRALLIESQQQVLVGEPEDAAREYTKLMAPNQPGKGTAGSKSARRGDSTCKMLDIKIEKIDEKEVVFSYKVQAEKRCKDPIFGFRIRNQTGLGLAGTNSLLQGKKLVPLEKGQKTKVVWRIENTFVDGDYYIDPSVVYEGGRTEADWWDGALVFTVARERRNPYLFQPTVHLEVSDGV